MMPVAADSVEMPAERQADPRPSRTELRAEAERWYRGQLAEVGRLCSLLLDMVAPAREAYRTGAPFTPEHEAALKHYREREADIARFACEAAASGAALTGRWPMEGEAAARARCATLDGAFAFIEEMEKVPVGFVDLPDTARTLQ